MAAILLQVAQAYLLQVAPVTRLLQGALESRCLAKQVHNYDGWEVQANHPMADTCSHNSFATRLTML